MDRQYTDRTILLDEASTATASAIGKGNYESFRNVELEVVMTNYTGTVKIAASNADDCPNFGAAASLSNPWDYVKCVNQIDGSAVNGGSGLAGTATTSVTQLEMNTNGFKWVGVITFSVSGGTVTVRGKGYSNT